MSHDIGDELQVLLERAVPRRRQYLRSPELDMKIIALAGLGIPLATISTAIGVPAATIRAWGKPDPEFRRALAEAINAGRRLNSDIAMARSAASERRLRSLLPRSAT